jgi:uncharacterized protein
MFRFIVTSILFLSSYYIWRRLVITSQLDGQTKQWIRLGFVLMIGIQISAPYWYRWFVRNGHGEPRALIWISYGFLGFLAVLLISTLISDLVGLFGHFFLWNEADPQRRLFISRVLNASALGLAVGGTVLGGRTALAGPRLQTVEVPVKGLHPDLDGFTIAQISDLHVGPTIRKAEAERVVRMAMQIGAQMIAVTGDLVDGTPTQLHDEIEPLRGLKATHGVYFVSGNHEYYWDIDSWIGKPANLG